MILRISSVFCYGLVEFENNMLNEIFKNKFPSKITCYKVMTIVPLLVDYRANELLMNAVVVVVAQLFDNYVIV